MLPMANFISLYKIRAVILIKDEATIKNQIEKT